MFDPFVQFVILLPLGAYLLVIGWLNSLRRPRVVSGSRDFLAMGLGCSGLFLAGPFSLFFPQSAFNIFGGWVWLAILMLYLLCVILVMLSLRPRLLIYSANSASFVQCLNACLRELDPQTQWAGVAFYCPQLLIEGRIETRHGERVIQVVASSRDQNLESWYRLQHGLSEAFAKQSEVAMRVSGWLLLGVALICAALSSIVLRPEETLAAMRELLRF